MIIKLPIYVEKEILRCAYLRGEVDWTESTCQDTKMERKRERERKGPQPPPSTNYTNINCARVF